MPAAIELQPNPGPRAIGGDLGRFWTLTRLSAVAQFKLIYAGSVLGYVWTLVRPLAMFAVIYVVFSEFLGVGTGIVDYPAILLFNLLLFQFFADASGRSVQSMVGSESTLRKMEFPRAVIPSAVIVAATFTFALNLIAVLAILLIAGIQPALTWLLLPLLWLALLVFTAAACFLLSTLFVQYRDVAQIWTVVSLTIFYASPVMYPTERIPEGFRWILAVNPLAPIFELSRKWLVDPSAPGVVEAAGGPWGWYGPALGFAAVVVGAVLVFRKRSRTLAELL